jgi:hypothetical protein
LFIFAGFHISGQIIGKAFFELQRQSLSRIAFGINGVHQGFGARAKNISFDEPNHGGLH